MPLNSNKINAMQKCGTFQVFNAILVHKINKANMYTIMRRNEAREREREKKKKRRNNH